ncbi:MAG: hypothetical protein FWD65_04155 [Coriobacteriia bacterium]|nr:hypothetical protein [Coriobacteriia bacterium]
MKKAISNKKRWWNKRKAIASAIAAALVVALVTAGTYAWSAISQAALNEARSSASAPGGRLHDDFDGKNKDVYVENYGTTKIYARVKLSEYMEIGVGAGLKSADPGYGSKEATPLDPASDINDLSTWDVHIPASSDPAVCDNATSGKFHDYWTWTMGGKKTYMPTFDKDSASLATDITGLNTMGMTSGDYQHNVTDAQANTNGANNLFHKDGSHNQYTVGQVATDTATYTGGRQVTEGHTAKDTLPGTVVTMATWIADGCVPGPYWVVDTDGWAYWAQAIEPETATGLLLNQIELAQEMDQDWYYAIDVVGQMASLNDIDKIKDGTKEGQDLIDIITKGTVTSVKISPDPAPELSPGDTQQFTATVSGTNNPSNAVTWKITGKTDSTTSIDATGKLVLGPNEKGPSITVTATSAADTSKSASVNVPVKADTGDALIDTKNGDGPYDTPYSDTDNSKNLALVVKMKGDSFDDQTILESGAIPLSEILADGVGTAGIDVKTVDSSLGQYFSIGTAKNGSPAIVFAYVPDQAAWDAVTPEYPTVNVQLLLTKTGFKDTPITVILRYNGSLYTKG